MGSVTSPASHAEGGKIIGLSGDLLRFGVANPKLPKLRKVAFETISNFLTD